MVKLDQGRLNEKVFDRIRDYNSVGGYVKQMREETKKLKIEDKNLLKIKKNQRVLRCRRKGNKDS